MAARNSGQSLTLSCRKLNNSTRFLLTIFHLRRRISRLSVQNTVLCCVYMAEWPCRAVDQRI